MRELEQPLIMSNEQRFGAILPHYYNEPRALNSLQLSFFREIDARSGKVKAYRPHVFLFETFFPGIFRGMRGKCGLTENDWKRKFDETGKAIQAKYGLSETTFIRMILEKRHLTTLEEYIAEVQRAFPDNFLDHLLPLDYLKHVDPFSSPLFKDSPAYFEEIRTLLWNLIQDAPATYSLRHVFWLALCTRQPAARLTTFLERDGTLVTPAEPAEEEIDEYDDMGDTCNIDIPLHFVCWSDNLEAAQCLFQHRAPRNQPSSQHIGMTELHFAYRYSSPELINWLEEQGSNPNMLDEQERRPFHMACIGGRRLNIFIPLLNAFLARHQNEVDVVINQLKEPAIASGEIELLDYFWDHRRVQLVAEDYTNAVMDGHVHLIPWLRQRKVPLDRSAIENMLINARNRGLLKVFQYVCEYLDETNQHDQKRSILSAWLCHVVIDDFRQDTSEVIAFLLNLGVFIYFNRTTGIPHIVNSYMPRNPRISSNICYLLQESVRRMPMERNEEWDHYWTILGNHFESHIIPLCQTHQNPELILVCAIRIGMGTAQLHTLMSYTNPHLNAVREKFGIDLKKLCEVFNPTALAVLFPDEQVVEIPQAYVVRR